MSNFLGIAEKTFLVSGFANRKSVAWHVAESLEQEGAHIIYTVRSQKRHTELLSLKPNAEVVICDFEKAQDIHSLGSYLENKENNSIQGVLHSIAFANYSEGLKPFHAFFCGHRECMVHDQVDSLF